MDEANAMIQQYKILAQSSINGSNGRTEPYDNAFAALNKARKSNNDSPIDRSIEPLVQRAATSAELSKYFERLADDMLLELHTVTPYRSNSIRLPPLQSKTNRPVDMRLEYTEEDAAYLEQLAMETWSNALNDGEMLDDVPDDDGNALHLDREHERVLEAEEFANARGKTAPMDDEVIHDMAHLYFASYYDDSDGEVDDSHIKQTASKCRAMGKAKGEAASRASMSHVLQGYIGDIYSDDSNAPSTRAGRRPSISMTA
ncbi:hypothetical protein DYB32_001672 [Aphanomyces invadans]|uniref:Uncharacterized protein n=1 Tax=Aphanomyces invadans TaxID=157072 RepID=A0A418B5D9_9STRA|nr:hypothetical protein DYB32_001672 [Aphanomyces invadans]